MSLPHSLPPGGLTTFPARRMTLPLLLLSLLAALFLLLPILANPDDWGGWLLLYASPCALLTFREIRTDRRLLLACYVGLLAHYAVAIFNRYVGIALFATGDPMDFHRAGSNTAIGVEDRYAQIFGLAAFTYYLAAFYSVFGTSLFVGEQASILAFALSCGVFVHLLRIWGLSRERVLYVLLFALLPSTIMFTSVTLRESCQTLLFLLCLLNVLRLREHTTLKQAMKLLACIVGLATLHNGLTVFCALFFVMCLWWGLGASTNQEILKWRVYGLAITGAAGVLVMAVAKKSGDLARAIIEGDIIRYWQVYRIGLKGFEGTRANYDIPMDISSPIGIFISAGLAFVYYMLAPFPWQVGNMMDIYVMVEGWLRCALLACGILAWRRSQGEMRSRYGFLLATIFLMEFLWGVGTGNWGTGVRHHVLVWGPTLMVGGPIFLRWVSGQYRAILNLPPPMTEHVPGIE